MNKTVHRRISALGASLLFIVLFTTSCGLFDKELKQDKHVAVYQHMILQALDSLDSSTDRITVFGDVLNKIEKDEALISFSKKSGLKKTCYIFISNEYCKLKKHDDALEYSNKFISLDSLDARGYYNRAVVYQELERDSLASVDYTKAIKLNPQYASAYYNMAILYEEWGNTENALTYYSKAIEMDPPYLKDVFINRGNVYIKMNDAEKALLDYDSAIGLDSTDVIAYYNRGNGHLQVEDYKSAIRDYSRALRIDSGFVDVYSKRANAYEMVTMYEEALQDYRSAMKLSHSSRDSVVVTSQQAIKRIKKASSKNR